MKTLVGSCPTPLKQRSEYTHRHNSTCGRYGWLRLTPAYSLKIVQEILSDIRPRARVLDPFSGTGTTPLCAAYSGHEGCAVEINPFLVWLGRAKVDRYSREDINAASSAADSALEAVSNCAALPVPLPPIHNIGRWWKPKALDFLRSLKGALEFGCSGMGRPKSLLMVAFCRTLIKLSNAAFNHQSMSFRDDNGQLGMFDSGGESSACADLFRRDVEFVLSSALDNPEGNASVAQGDARAIGKLLSYPCDLVITSPPYPNRISYVRELRPYMYWLGFLTNARDAAELDWASIGGTWGVATSRLNTWERSRSGLLPPYLDTILTGIASEGNLSGRILSNYVARYFEDTYRHLKELRGVLSKGAMVHYVVGNSTFYDVLVPVERLYADIMTHLGFAHVEIAPIRKRNSKKELIEFDISARWNG